MGKCPPEGRSSKLSDEAHIGARGLINIRRNE